MKGWVWLTAKAENGVGTICIEEANTRCISVVGASMPISANHNTTVTSFSLELEERSTKGVIALAVSALRENKTHYIFVPVLKSGEKLEIKYAESFVPEKGRLGQIYDGGKIEVVIGDVIYANILPSELGEPHLEYHLVNADSLCKYMVGIIDKYQLEQASIQCIAALAEEDYIRGLEERLNRKEMDLEELALKCADLHSAELALREEITMLKLNHGDECADRKKELSSLYVQIETLKKGAYKDYSKGKRYVFSGPIYDAIDTFFSRVLPGHMDR